MTRRVVATFLCLSLMTACGSSDYVVPPDMGRLSTEDGGSTVRSDFLVNSCGAPGRLEVEESPTVVEVRTVVRSEGGDCDDIGISAPDTSQLDEPLGERQLVAAE